MLLGVLPAAAVVLAVVMLNGIRAWNDATETLERDPPHPRARAFDLEVDPVGLRCAVL